MKLLYISLEYVYLHTSCLHIQYRENIFCFMPDDPDYEDLKNSNADYYYDGEVWCYESDSTASNITAINTYISNDNYDNNMVIIQWEWQY